MCPHAGGVGLCEMVQHLQMWDYVALSGTSEGRLIEYIDQQHEHFVDPVVVKNAKYLAPKVGLDPAPPSYGVPYLHTDFGF